MSQTLLTNIVYVTAFLVTIVATHFGLVPAGTEQIVLGILAGSAATTGTLVPNKSVVVKQGSTPSSNTNVRG